jgi:hypothetical protein
MKKKFGTGIIISGNVIMTNYHLFAGRRNFLFTFMSGRVLREDFHQTLGELDVFEVPDRDLLFFRVRNMPCHRSLVDLFPHANLKDANCPATMMTRGKDGVLVVRESKRCSYVEDREVAHAETDRIYTCAGYEMYISDTQSGDCGSPYILWTNCGPSIVGIHQSLGMHAQCAGVVYNDLELAMDHFGPQVQGGTLLRENMDFEMKSLSMNSNLRRIEEPLGFSFGSTSHRFPSKSKICKSVIFEDCIQRGYPDAYSGPRMHGRKVWLNQMMPIFVKKNLLDLNLLDKAKAMYISETNEALPVDFLEGLRVLTDDEAVNGIDGVAYIDKIPRKTSAGFPLNKSKKHFLVLNEEGRAVVDETIMDDAHDLEEIYANLERGYPVFMGNLKDEARKREKYDNHETRMFTGSPFSFSIVFRKYYLPLTALIQQNTQLFEVTQERMRVGRLGLAYINS